MNDGRDLGFRGRISVALSGLFGAVGLGITLRCPSCSATAAAAAAASTPALGARFGGILLSAVSKLGRDRGLRNGIRYGFDGKAALFGLALRG